MSRLKPLVITTLLVACAGSAAAQGVSMLNPMQPRYVVLGFVFAPPKVDGWRELASQPDAVRIVYAEQLDNSQINTRADVTIQAFPVDDPTKVPDAATLTRLSMNQRVEEKKNETGTELVAMSYPQALTGEVPAYEYQLNLKVGDEEVFEDYFVALAPDKSQYLAAKLVTKDKDFRELPYFKPLQDSMTQLKFANAAPAPAASPAPAEAVAPQASEASSASPQSGTSKPADTAPAPPGVK